MTLKLLEAAVDALKDYISDTITAKITALNTEYEDSLLTEFKACYIGNVPDAFPELPSLAFQGDGFTPLSQNKSTLELDNDIYIWVYVGDQESETRFRKLCRYARAILELLNEGEATCGYPHFISGKVQFTDTLSRSGDFLQAVMIPVRLTKAEDY
ncbi:MAG: hypothetical protein PHQ43_05750 [Dehalococcoidales bacterium]|nr:hypothetical protein [Dehalococcoidales bacterium]